MVALKAKETWLREADSYERAIEELLDKAVRRGERWMSKCRILFSVGILVRFIVLGDFWDGKQVPPKSLFVLTALICTIVLSLWLIRRASPREPVARWGEPMARWVLALSVIVDSGSCFLALLANALWSDSNYVGNLVKPDGAIIWLVIIISGFRLRPLLVWLSAGLNVITVTILIVVDRCILGIEYGHWDVSIIVICGAASTVLAMIVARQTRSLVETGAQESVRAQRARDAVRTILQDHHEVYSYVSSANLNATYLLRGLDERHPQREKAEYLQEDLQAITDIMSALTERAIHELASAKGFLGADLTRAVQAAISSVTGRFPDVRVNCSVSDALQVRVIGGVDVLQRILLDLLRNACQGDGSRRASSIWVSAYEKNEDVHIVIADDGPGFPEAALRAHTTYIETSKRGGSGLGLFIVQDVASASGGRLSLGQRTGGGASVELILPKWED